VVETECLTINPDVMEVWVVGVVGVLYISHL
jgi:hypothetical protein